MLAGGLLDTAGTFSYHRRWPDLYPSVFGYHEVFHAYVCAAAACQYLGEGSRGNGTSNAGTSGRGSRRAARGRP